MYKQLVDSNDIAVEEGLSRQVLDQESRYYGGTLDPGTGVAWVNHTTGTPTDMCYWGLHWRTPIPSTTGMNGCWAGCSWRRNLCCAPSMRTAPSPRAGRIIILRRIRPLSS